MGRRDLSSRRELKAGLGDWRGEWLAIDTGKGDEVYEEALKGLLREAWCIT